MDENPLPFGAGEVEENREGRPVGGTRGCAASRGLRGSTGRAASRCGVGRPQSDCPAGFAERRGSERSRRLQRLRAHAHQSEAGGNAGEDVGALEH